MHQLPPEPPPRDPLLHLVHFPDPNHYHPSPNLLVRCAKDGRQQQTDASQSPRPQASVRQSVYVADISEATYFRCIENDTRTYTRVKHRDRGAHADGLAESCAERRDAMGPNHGRRLWSHDEVTGTSSPRRGIRG